MLSVEQWLQTIITVVFTLAGSSGLWAYMQHRDKEKSQTQRLLQGLAYEKIISMGMDYLKRGGITNDEYNDYRRLYEAYRALGGNGVTERVMAAVQDLPVKSRDTYSKVIQAAKTEGKEQRDTDNELAEAA